MTRTPGARISPGGEQFRDDDGAADPVVTAALGRWQARSGTERDALAALHASRLLVPVVAIPGERDDSGADKSSEMALPKLIGNDGRPALVAFTSTAALARWRPDARPVAARAPRVWQAAVAESAAVVIDVAGPVTFVVEGARLAALAAGQPPPPPHEDPDVRQEIITAVTGLPAITAFRLGPGDEPRGIDLTIRLTVSVGPASMETRAASMATGPASMETRAARSSPDGALCRTNHEGGREGEWREGEREAGEQVRAAAERISARLAERVRAVEITTE